MCKTLFWRKNYGTFHVTLILWSLFQKSVTRLLTLNKIHLKFWLKGIYEINHFSWTPFVLTSTLLCLLKQYSQILREIIVRFCLWVCILQPPRQGAYWSVGSNSLSSLHVALSCTHCCIRCIPTPRLPCVSPAESYSRHVAISNGLLEQKYCLTCRPCNPNAFNAHCSGCSFISLS